MVTRIFVVINAMDSEGYSLFRRRIMNKIS